VGFTYAIETINPEILGELGISSSSLISSQRVTLRGELLHFLQKSKELWRHRKITDRMMDTGKET